MMGEEEGWVFVAILAPPARRAHPLIEPVTGCYYLIKYAAGVMVG